jgi:hypothetical protein
MGCTACTEPQCLYSRGIPLLPLWVVRPVQSLSACTVELYLYSPYGLYGLYRASVPVQRSILTLPHTHTHTHTHIYIYICQYFLHEKTSFCISNTLLRNFKKNELGGVCSMYGKTRGAHRVLLGEPEVKKSL